MKIVLLGSVSPLAWVLFDLVATQGLSNLPSCAQKCFFGSADGCAQADIKCHCQSSHLQNTTSCIKTSCSAEDADRTLSFMQAVCSGPGAPVISSTSLTSMETSTVTSSPARTTTDPSSSQTGPNPSSTPTSKKTSLSAGTAAGAAVGATLAVVVAALTGYMLWRRRRRAKLAAVVPTVEKVPSIEKVPDSGYYAHELEGGQVHELYGEHGPELGEGQSHELGEGQGVPVSRKELEDPHGAQAARERHGELP